MFGLFSGKIKRRKIRDILTDKINELEHSKLECQRMIASLNDTISSLDLQNVQNLESLIPLRTARDTKVKEMQIIDCNLTWIYELRAKI